MANDIIKPNGEYLRNEFTGSSGRWKLIGSECTKSNALSCLDSFKNVNTGKYGTRVRLNVFNEAENGKIW